MNKLTSARRAAIVRALCEGNSIRATARRIGTAKATVLKLLVELGELCSIYQDHILRNLPTRRVEVDEIWTFCGAKQKDATKGGQGDIWTFAAIDAESKLMISWLVGPWNHETTFAFMQDVALRLANRVQLTSHGSSWYVAALEEAFGWDGIDCAQLIKTYDTPLDEPGRHRRSTPAVCTVVIRTPIMGGPDMGYASASNVERQNLNIQMQMRRFTRLTNGFSRKAENHAHAVSLYFMYYNFCRAHTTMTKSAGSIKLTPAMAAGLTDHAWDVEEILGLMNPMRLLHSN